MSGVESRFGKLALRAAVGLLGATSLAPAHALDIGSAGHDANIPAANLVPSPGVSDADDRTRSGCRIEPLNPAEAPLGIAARPLEGKSAAILGGMSALEIMRSEQASLAAPSPAPAQSAAAAIELAGSLEPAIGGFAARLPGCEQADRVAMLARPGLNSLPPAMPRASDFLQSRRVPIGSTRFDAQWQRASHGTLSKQQYGRIVGKEHAQGAALLERVNAWVNSNIRYVEDSRLWGSVDYWASAGETLRRARGDCEDLAIVKMKILERAGISRDDMYLTVARDLYRNADHAFLVVKLDGQFYVLDNAVDQVLLADQELGYRPVLSFNGQRSWLHGY